MKNNKQKILFICTHNSVRSQMAEGMINSFYKDRFEAYSAGTEPTEVSPYAVEVMSEIGIGISKQSSKSIEEFRTEKIDYAVTVCDHANETCPFFPGGAEHIHKGFKDPSKLSGNEAFLRSEFREIRDNIRKWLEEKFGRKF